MLDLLIIAVTRSARFILRSNILYCKQVVKAEKTFEGVDGKTMLSGIHCVFQQRKVTHWGWEEKGVCCLLISVFWWEICLHLIAWHLTDSDL